VPGHANRWSSQAPGSPCHPTSCSEGTPPTSPDAAGRGLMCRLPAPIIAVRGRASPDICRRWLPSWLPRYLARLTFERPNGVANQASGWPASRPNRAVGCDNRRVRVVVRRARSDDQPVITAMVRRARLNPAGLHWEQFVVGERNGRPVGVAQLRRHSDGAKELASLAVEPGAREHGIATQMVDALLAGRDSGRVRVDRSPLRGPLRPLGLQSGRSQRAAALGISDLPDRPRGNHPREPAAPAADPHRAPASPRSLIAADEDPLVRSMRPAAQLLILKAIDRPVDGFQDPRRARQGAVLPRCPWPPRATGAAWGCPVCSQPCTRAGFTIRNRPPARSRAHTRRSVRQLLNVAGRRLRPDQLICRLGASQCFQRLRDASCSLR
jgi:Acetyltransferase (GNAT) family